MRKHFLIGQKAIYLFNYLKSDRVFIYKLQIMFFSRRMCLPLFSHGALLRQYDEQRRY